MVSDLTDSLREDFEAFVDLDPVKPRSVRRTLDVLTNSGFLAVVLYRVAAKAWRAKLLPVARLLTLLQTTLFGCEISPQVIAGQGLTLPHPHGVVIGAGARLGSRVTVFQGVTLGTMGFTGGNLDKEGWPVIGDGCTIFSHAGIFGPIEVGDKSVVGANVVLTESVPANTIVTAEQSLKFRSIENQD